MAKRGKTMTNARKNEHRNIKYVVYQGEIAWSRSENVIA